VPSAEWSEKTPVEDKQDIFTLQCRQAHSFPGKIQQFEIWRRGM